MQQTASEPALILLDSSFRPVSYNAEAIRVLIYPQSVKSSHLSLLEAKLRAILVPLRSSKQPSPEPIFHSGERQYRVRLFSLNKSQNLSPSHPAHALMLDRHDRTVVDISTAATFFNLTPREQETLSFLIQGMTSKEIATQMGVSPHTIKAFLRLVMSKMQVSTRSGIIGKLVSTQP
jgi:DNA-binding CsgD family transcriptional regulator